MNAAMLIGGARQFSTNASGLAQLLTRVVAQVRSGAAGSGAGIISGWRRSDRNECALHSHAGKSQH